jgi:methyl-accepting chemotaxis protein
MRIRTSFLAGFTAVMLPGLLATGWLAWEDWGQWNRAFDARNAAEVVADVQRATTAVALEVGQMNVAAIAAHPDLAQLEPANRDTARLLAAANQSAAKAGFDAQRLADVKAAVDKIYGALPALVTKAPDQRDPAFVRDLLQRRSEIGMQMLSLAGNAAKRISLDAPSMAAPVTVASMVMTVRDLVGRRSLMMNNWLGSQSVPAKQVIEADRLTGGLDLAWATVRQTIAALNGGAVVEEELARQEKTFWERDEPRWRAMVEIARTHVDGTSGAVVAWPGDLTQYRSWSLPGQAGILVLRDVALSFALDRCTAAAAAARNHLLLALGLVGVALLVSLGSTILLLRRIVLPLQRLTVTVEQIAGGALGVEVPSQTQQDEIGALARSVQVFKDGLLRTRQMESEQAEANARRSQEDSQMRTAAEQAAATEAASLVVGSIGKALERLAAGDLTFRLDVALPDAYEQLRADLNVTVAELETVLRDVVSNTSAIQSGTAEIRDASNDLSRRTENQAASLEETAAALEEITATVHKTADGAKHARDIVSQTKQDAERSETVVQQAVAAMGGIEKSSREISDIIGVIDEIAFQTNLLALNAGVEAARAGDAGRGFAVVASEVRALAQRSAGAAKEIKTLIFTSAEQVGSGVKLVRETGQVLGRILAQVSEITTVVTDIAASAQEQAAGLSQVNTAVNQMDQVTQQNAAMVEETTAASTTLAERTQELSALTGRFKLSGGGRGGSAAAVVKLRPAPSAAPKLRAVSAPRPQATAAARKMEVAEDPGWEEF